MNGFNPFFNPYFSRNPSYYNGNFGTNINKNIDKNNLHNVNEINNNFEKKSYFPSISQDNNDDYFDFLGIKLHSDDLLIIFLLFILYNEDVKDIYLYIALILLLLS